MASKNSAAVQKVVIGLVAVAIIVGAYYASSMKTPVPMISSEPPDAKADATILTDAAGVPNAAMTDAAEAATATDAAENPDASAYDRHMTLGEEFRAAKKYAEAIAEFDLALKEQRDDAKAIAARAEAKFGANDVRGANDDYATALTKTRDAETLAGIWLRRAELDHAIFGDEAKSAYLAAWSLNASKEAEAKMGGRCQHAIERRDLTAKGGDAGADPFLYSAANVVALLPALPGWNEQHEALADAGKPTEAQVWRVADVTTAPVLPTVVRLYDYTKAASYLVFRARSRVWALQLSQLFTVWNATGEENFSIVTADAGRIHVHGYFAQAKEEVTPVPGGNAHATLPGRLVEVDALVDLTKNRALWITRDKPGRMAERDTTPSMKASLAPTGLALDGLGCTETVPLIEGSPIKDAGH